MYLNKINKRDIVVKVQYPGVNKSIDSDLDNLLFVLKMFNIAPKQMYIHKVMILF